MSREASVAINAAAGEKLVEWRFQAPARCMSAGGGGFHAHRAASSRVRWPASSDPRQVLIREGRALGPSQSPAPGNGHVT